VSVLTFAVLLFPDGRLPSRAWRPLAWVAAVSLLGIVVPTAIAALHDPILVATSEEVGSVHPVAIGAQLVGLAGACLASVASLGSLVVRYRRADRTERLQLKWFISGAVTFIVPTLGLVVALEAFGRGTDVVTSLAAIVLVPAIPVAVGVAVLRYRLYEIDRLVSRTLSYALLTLLLAAVYVTGVVVLGVVVRAPTGRTSELVVAASTLAAAAAFQPLRGRSQQLVDRRFDRTRYDLQRTLDGFGARLRDEVDLDRLVGEVAGVAATAIQPTHASVWLLPRPGPG